MTDIKQLEKRQGVLQGYREAIKRSLVFVRHEEKVVLEKLKKELDEEFDEIITIRFPLDK